MKVKDCESWKAIHFPGCTYLPKDLKLMSADQRQTFLNMEVTPMNRKGHYSLAV